MTSYELHTLLMSTWIALRYAYTCPSRVTSGTAGNKEKVV